MFRMMKTIKILIAILICFTAVILTGCEKQPLCRNDDIDDLSSDTVNKYIGLTQMLNEDGNFLYTIIRGENADESIASVAVTLYNTVKSIYVLNDFQISQHW